MSRGDYAVLKPMTPNVDIWRRVWNAVDRVSANQDDVRIIWIRSHQKAHANERV